METPFSVRALVLVALLADYAHGGELIQRIGRISQGMIILSAGSVYPVLRALESEGLIESVPQEGEQKTGRPRIVFRLTEQGTEQAKSVRELMVKFGTINILQEVKA